MAQVELLRDLIEAEDHLLVSRSVCFEMLAGVREAEIARWSSSAQASPGCRWGRRRRALPVLSHANTAVPTANR
jgi:hypothetical protein